MMANRGPMGAAFSERGPEKDDSQTGAAWVDPLTREERLEADRAVNAEASRMREEAKQRALAKAKGEIERLGKPDREFYQECASRSGMSLPEWWIVRNEIQ